MNVLSTKETKMTNPMPYAFRRQGMAGLSGVRRNSVPPGEYRFQHLLPGKMRIELQ